MRAYHGSKSGIRGRIRPISRTTCDFDRGFYLGDDRAQVARQCASGDTPVIYDLELDLTGMRVLTLSQTLHGQ